MLVCLWGGWVGGWVSYLLLNNWDWFSFFLSSELPGKKLSFFFFFKEKSVFFRWESWLVFCLHKQRERCGDFFWKWRHWYSSHLSIQGGGIKMKGLKAELYLLALFGTCLNKKCCLNWIAKDHRRRWCGPGTSLSPRPCSCVAGFCKQRGSSDTSAATSEGCAGSHVES